MSRFEKSIILMGVNWSKAAKLMAVKDISTEEPRISNIIRDLEYLYRKKQS